MCDGIDGFIKEEFHLDGEEGGDMEVGAGWDGLQDRPHVRQEIPTCPQMYPSITSRLAADAQMASSEVVQRNL